MNDEDPVEPKEAEEMLITEEVELPNEEEQIESQHGSIYDVDQDELQKSDRLIEEAIPDPAKKLFEQDDIQAQDLHTGDLSREEILLPSNLEEIDQIELNI